MSLHYRCLDEQGQVRVPPPRTSVQLLRGERAHLTHRLFAAARERLHFMLSLLWCFMEGCAENMTTLMQADNVSWSCRW